MPSLWLTEQQDVGISAPLAARLKAKQESQREQMGERGEAIGEMSPEQQRAGRAGVLICVGGTSQPPTPTSQPRVPQVPIMGTEGVLSQNSRPLHPFHVASPWRRAELLPAWMECQSHGPSSEQRQKGGKSSPLIPIPAVHPSLPNQTKRASPSLPDAAPSPSPGPPHLAQVRPASRGCWRRSRGTGGPAASLREEGCARALGTGCHQCRSIPSSPHASSTPDCLR